MNTYVFGIFATYAILGMYWLGLLCYLATVYSAAFVNDKSVSGQPTPMLLIKCYNHDGGDTVGAMFLLLFGGLLFGGIWIVAWPVLAFVGLLRGLRMAARFRADYKRHTHGEDGRVN